MLRIKRKAKKLDNFDAAVETPLAETRSALDAKVASFGNSKGALQTIYKTNSKVGSCYILGTTVPFRCSPSIGQEQSPIRFV